MRLGQLTRKLELRAGEIVSFLGTKGIRIEEGSNTRLDDEHVLLVMEKYAPASKSEITQELELEKTAEPVPVEKPEFPVAESEERVPELSQPVEEESKPEVIKAPKVELSGLKVLGKIELPELKKKVAEQPEANEKQEASEGDTRRPLAPRRAKTPPRREKKNPIAQQREQEALDREKKRLEQVELQKEQRTRNYQKRVKTAAPTKRVKMVEEPTEDMSATDLREPPKTLVGKFFRWLRT